MPNYAGTFSLKWWAASHCALVLFLITYSAEPSTVDAPILQWSHFGVSVGSDASLKCKYKFDLTPIGYGLIRPLFCQPLRASRAQAHLHPHMSTVLRPPCPSLELVSLFLPCTIQINSHCTLNLPSIFCSQSGEVLAVWHSDDLLRSSSFRKSIKLHMSI
jgi:hypothetical protein